MNIKISKLPDAINPDDLIEKEICKRFADCPFCGAKYHELYSEELSEVVRFSTESWYGYYYQCNDFGCSYNGINVGFWKRLKDFFNPKEKKRWWKVEEFYCHKCNAKWWTPPYPTRILDSLDDFELTDFYNAYMNDNGKSIMDNYLPDKRMEQ